MSCKHTIPAIAAASASKARPKQEAAPAVPHHSVSKHRHIFTLQKLEIMNSADLSRLGREKLQVPLP